MAPKPASRVYWMCQLGGWSLYALLNFLVFTAAQGHPLRVAAVSGFLSAVGFGITHAFRRSYGQRWRTLGLLALAPRVVLASVVMGVGFLSALLLTVAIRGRNPDVPLDALNVIVLLVNGSIVFMAWQLIYFGVHFLTRSRRAEMESLKARSAAQAAELRHLKAQLNPHFLFNCLNSLRALVPEDPVRAQQAITQLANLLRYALAAEGETVPLERELQVVRDYLALEGIRLEERLRVRIDVEPACLGAAVPAMLVQSLVENGIKHGVARLSAGGEIAVVGRQREGVLELEVINTNSANGQVATPATGGSGIGLVNASERLRLLFGERAHFELDRSSLDRTIARVQLPWQP